MILLLRRNEHTAKGICAQRKPQPDAFQPCLVSFPLERGRRSTFRSHAREGLRQKLVKLISRDMRVHTQHQRKVHGLETRTSTAPQKKKPRQIVC